MSDDAPKPLTDSEELFALEYLANGQNGLAAYQKVHPRTTKGTAAVQASRLIKRPNVRAFLDAQIAERKRQLVMDGDEALQGLTRIARGDIRKLYRHNRLLPINEWPDDIADCVKGLKPTAFGTAVSLHDKMHARELMAINAGKLKLNLDHTHRFDHASYLGSEPPPGDDE